MSEARDWQPAFVAMGVLLGDAPDDALAALGDAPAPEAQALARALKAPSREARARQLAAAIAGIVAEIEEARLA